MSGCLNCLFSKAGVVGLGGLGLCICLFAVTSGVPLGISFLSGLLTFLGCFLCCLGAELVRLLCPRVRVIPEPAELEFAAVMGATLAQRAAGIPVGVGLDVGAVLAVI
jgi:hypothetical protein